MQKGFLDSALTPQFAMGVGVGSGSIAIHFRNYETEDPGLNKRICALAAKRAGQ